MEGGRSICSSAVLGEVHPVPVTWHLSCPHHAGPPVARWQRKLPAKMLWELAALSQPKKRVQII